MKVNNPEKELLQMAFLAQDFLSGVAAVVKGFLARAYVHGDKTSYWQIVLLQSKANGCSYHGEGLSQINWEWPKNTWFQKRLSHYLR